LFYYDVANGFDYDYYNTTRSQSYTPLFAVQPTAQQVQEAQMLCTVNNVLIEACAYDYYVTGNAEASSVTASVDSFYTAAQEMLGLYVASLTSRLGLVLHCGRPLCIPCLKKLGTFLFFE